MKILSLKINNFGKFSGFARNFNENEAISEFLYPNGYGKTTITTFLLGCFYTLDKDLKTKYTSWINPNGEYSGSLKISFNNEEYLLERNFKDNSVILKNLTKNKIVDLNGKEPGEYFFHGENKGTFLKTLLITQETFNQKATANLNIHDLLNSKINGVFDSLEYDNVKASLEEKVNNISSNRKKVSIIKQISNEIEDNNKKIESLRKLIFEKNNIYNEDKYKEYLEKEKSLKLSQEKALEKQKELNVLISLEEKNNNLQLNLENLKNELKNINETIILENFDELKNLVSDFDSYKEEYNFLKSKLQSDKLELNDYQKYQNVSDDEIKTVSLEINNLNNKEQNKHNKENRFKLLYLWFIPILVFLIGGISSLISLKNIIYIGIILLVLGAISILGFIFNYLLLKKNSKKIEKKFDLEGFFNKLGLNGNFNDCLENVITGRKNYEKLLILIKDSEKKLIEHENELELKKNKIINLFIKSYKKFDNSISFHENLFSYSNLINNRNVLSNKIDKAKKEYDNFLEENKLNLDKVNLIKEELKEYESLETENLDELHRKIIEQEKAYDSIINSENEIEELEQKNEKLKEDFKKYKEKANLYKKAINYLEQAYSKLKSLYISPLKDKLDNYLKASNFDAFKDYEININNKNKDTRIFSLSYNLDNSNLKPDEKTLSKGYSDFLDILIRITLIDLIYKDEENVILIFDDPFVNMDEIRFNNMKKLLNSLSNRFQILYFICHKSRSLK